MPEDLTDSISGSTELVFPDDATGKYSLTERSVYDAEEVRLELDSDVPQYGSWIPVTDTEPSQEAWLTAPSELRSATLENEICIAVPFPIATKGKRGT